MSSFNNLSRQSDATLRVLVTLPGSRKPIFERILSLGEVESFPYSQCVCVMSHLFGHGVNVDFNVCAL